MKKDLTVDTAAGMAHTCVKHAGKKQPNKQEKREKRQAATIPAQKASNASLPHCEVLLKKRGQQLQIGGKGDYQWQVHGEHGKTFQGSRCAGELLTLPANLPNGYQQLLLRQGKKQWVWRVVVAP
ncbi:4-alpha-glucanotransferase, partial [Erwinia amylovora]